MLRVKSPGGPGAGARGEPVALRPRARARVACPAGAVARPRDLAARPPRLSLAGTAAPGSAVPSGPARAGADGRRPASDAALRSSPRPDRSSAGDAVAERVLAIVAEKTGYPPEMLDMDLDLEADLGVDTVKQAEIFAAVREAYGIARQENLKLRDFPTLTHVVKFVYDFRPDVAKRREAPALPGSPSPGSPLDGRPEALRTAPRTRPATPHSSSPVRTDAPRMTSSRRSSRSWPRRPATRRTCWRWTSTSRPTSASTP